MPINWTGFQSDLESFYSTQMDSSYSEAADEISTIFHNAILQGSLAIGNTILSGLNKIVLKTAFETSYELNMNANGVDLGLAPFTIIANGFVSYITPVQFSPLPPHPPATVPSTGVTTTFFGLPTPLDIDLKNAMTAGKDIGDVSISSKAIASKLVTALQTFLSTISGIYTGLMPSPTGLVAAPPVPWVGIT